MYAQSRINSPLTQRGYYGESLTLNKEAIVVHTTQDEEEIQDDKEEENDEVKQKEV